MSTTTTVTTAALPGMSHEPGKVLPIDRNDVSASSVLHAKLDVRPPKIVAAKGNYLVTEDGVQIFDATGGAAVACIGHNHPRVKQAIMAQLDAVDYCYSPFFTTAASERLADFLVDSTKGQMTKAFIVSSGTEAVEAALKMARQYYMELPQPQMHRTRFIARLQSYHGNTLGSLSLGGHKARRAIYEPLLSSNVSHVSPCYPYRGMRESETEGIYVARLAQELEDEFQRVGPETVCAFVAESMAGLTLGAVPPSPAYLAAMKQVCDRHGALFVLDEVMSGMGRTGTLHAWEQEGVVPHLQTVAKGLGAGYEPIGALLVHRTVVDVLSRGTKAFVHSQTYQGHPVACAAAYEVQQVIQEGNMIDNARNMGVHLGRLLKQRLEAHRNVGDIRGRGLFWGVELVEDKNTKKPFPASRKLAATIHGVGLRREFAISLMPGAGVADGQDGDVIVVAPAYNVTKDEIETIVERTVRVIEHVLGE